MINTYINLYLGSHSWITFLFTYIIDFFLKKFYFSNIFESQISYERECHMIPYILNKCLQYISKAK